MQTAIISAIPARGVDASRVEDTTSATRDVLWTVASVGLGLLSGGITGLAGVLIWCGISASTVSNPGTIPLIVGGVIAPGFGAFAVFLATAASAASSASEAQQN